MTPNEQAQKQHRDDGAFGFNDDEGVYCGFVGCGWRHMCLTIEEMESHLKAHVLEVHGLKVLYRIGYETGKLTRIP